VAEDGQLPLPWLAAPLAELLARQRGHALLLHASAGQGALPLAVSLAQSWLCEAGDGHRLACGRCAGCRLVQARAHPDLLLLLPELQRRELGWPFAGDKPDAGESSRKPSRQIRIEEVRSSSTGCSRPRAAAAARWRCCTPASSSTHSRPTRC
jgi:DNA polymerase III subunit delta'